IWAKAAGARSIAGHAIAPATVPTALATGALVIEDLREGACEDSDLFHLLNLAREQGDFVLITAGNAPSGWATRLRDLASRRRADRDARRARRRAAARRDGQAVRRPPARGRRRADRLSRDPHRAFVRGRPRDRRRARPRGAAAEARDQPGAGGGAHARSVERVANVTLTSPAPWPS